MPKRTRGGSRQKDAPSTALVHVPAVPLATVAAARGDNPVVRFLQKYSRSRQSERTMRTRLNVAADILSTNSTAETYPWEMLDCAAVERVIAALNQRKPKPAAPATVNLTRAAIIRMARVLFSMGLMSVAERQRIEDVERAKGSRRRRGHALDAKEIRKLFKAAARDESAAGRRDAAMLACMYGGGLRRDEVAKLQLADYRGDGMLRVKGKGDKHVEAPIGPDAGAALEAWIAARGSWKGPLFVAVNKGGKIGRADLGGAAVAWMVRRLVRRSSIRETTPHDLRRSFVTALLDAGEDLSTVSRAARHASLSTTALYDMRDEKKVTAAVGRLVVPFGR